MAWAAAFRRCRRSAFWPRRSERTPISTTPSRRCRSARRRSDYRGNCGNMSSAVGPFAVDEGLVRPNGDTAVVRIFNTNTGKIIRSTFPLVDGRAAVDGDLAIPGVAGHRCTDPAGFPVTGRRGHRPAVADGQCRDRLEVPGLGPIEVSMVDAAKPLRLRPRPRYRPDRRRNCRMRSTPTRLCLTDCSASGAPPRRDGHCGGPRQRRFEVTACRRSVS